MSNKPSRSWYTQPGLTSTTGYPPSYSFQPPTHPIPAQCNHHYQNTNPPEVHMPHPPKYASWTADEGESSWYRTKPCESSGKTNTVTMHDKVDEAASSVSIFVRFYRWLQRRL